jgi:cytoskeleton protein RodZ
MDEIGARLREARMRAKIDINEVESRTKIRAKYLRAMENEEWDLLPGEVYVRSFLRTYGDFLGLDSRELVDDFRRGYENPSDHEPPPIAPPSRERHERQARQRQRGQRRFSPGRGVPPWAIVGVVLLVVAIVLVIVGTHGSPSPNDTTPKKTVTGQPHHHRHKHHKKRSVHHAPPPKPKTVSLSMTASGPSEVYVCLVNGAGKTLIPGKTYTPGEAIPTEVGKSLLLTLGNNSVTLKADGVSVPVAASPTAIGLKFTASGHTTLPAARQPTCAP